MNEKEFEELNVKIKKNTIEELHLYGAELTLEQMNQLGQCLRDNTSITSFAVSRSKFNDVIIALFAQVIEKNKILTHVDIEDNIGIDQKAVTLLVDAFEKNFTILKLDINYIDEEQQKRIEAYQERNAKLRQAIQSSPPGGAPFVLMYDEVLAHMPAQQVQHPPHLSHTPPRLHP